MSTGRATHTVSENQIAHTYGKENVCAVDHETQRRSMIIAHQEPRRLLFFYESVGVERVIHLES